jgi:hypothetical protein
MKGPVKTLVLGVTEARQAAEVGRLGVDGVVFAVGGALPCALTPPAAVDIAAALPPLTSRLALLPSGAPPPAGFWITVTAAVHPRPRAATTWIVRASPEGFDPARIPAGADGVWIQPAGAGTSSATRFDFPRIVEAGRTHRVILEVPDGAEGVETAIRLGFPYAVLFGEAVWFRPGIVDLDRLERALAVVARLNKNAFEV